jgi:hypothetical protein
MKAVCAMVAAGLGLMATTIPGSAQPYGVPEYRYEAPGFRYEEPGPRYRQPDYGYRERGPRYRGRADAFSEREYLYCNPDVRRAVRRGEMQSGLSHYLTFGRFEGRRVRC